MGMTLAEMGERMGSHEFSLHLALEREEGTGAQHWPHMWACLMAAVQNGPLTRPSRELWQPSDFREPSWVPPPPPPKPVTADSLRAFTSQIAAAGTPARRPKG